MKIRNFVIIQKVAEINVARVLRACRHHSNAPMNSGNFKICSHVRNQKKWLSLKLCGIFMLIKYYKYHEAKIMKLGYIVIKIAWYLFAYKIL